MPVPFLAEVGTKIVWPPHSSGTRLWLDSSRLTRSGSDSGLSILLTATMIGTFGRPRVVDRLHRLRHHAVVGGHHQDDDVGGLGAARPHGRERLVARRVQERDLAVAGHHLVGADVLRDAAELLLGHLRPADGVEQRGLAVVDVAHDGDDRRPQHQLGWIRLLLLDDVALDRADLEVEVELVGDQLGLGRDRAGR